MQFKPAQIIFSDAALKLCWSQSIKKLSSSYYEYNSQPLGNPDNQVNHTSENSEIVHSVVRPLYKSQKRPSEIEGRTEERGRNYTSFLCENRAIGLLYSAGTGGHVCFQEFHHLQKILFTSSKSIGQNQRWPRYIPVGQCSRWLKFPSGQNPEGHKWGISHLSLKGIIQCLSYRKELYQTMEEVKTWAPEVMRKKKYHICLSISSASTCGITSVRNKELLCYLN